MFRGHRHNYYKHILTNLRILQTFLKRKSKKKTYKSNATRRRIPNFLKKKFFLKFFYESDRIKGKEEGSMQRMSNYGFLRRVWFKRTLAIVFLLFLSILYFGNFDSNHQLHLPIHPRELEHHARESLQGGQEGKRFRVCSSNTFRIFQRLFF